MSNISLYETYEASCDESSNSETRVIDVMGHLDDIFSAPRQYFKKDESKRVKNASESPISKGSTEIQDLDFLEKGTKRYTKKTAKMSRLEAIRKKKESPDYKLKNRLSAFKTKHVVPVTSPVMHARSNIIRPQPINPMAAMMDVFNTTKELYVPFVNEKNERKRMQIRIQILDEE